MALVPMAYAHEDHDETAVSDQYITVNGAVEVVSIDDMATKKSRREYYIKDEQTGKIYELHFKKNAPHNLDRRKSIRIKGRVSGDNDIYLGVSEGADLSNTLATGSDSNSGNAAAYFVGDRKVLVSMMASSDSAAAACAATSINNALFYSANSSGNMYKEASHGAFTMGSGSIASVTVNANTALCPTYTQLSEWANSADASMKAQGIDPALYQHVSYILPPNVTCTWTGMGSMGGKRTWLRASYCAHPEVYAHEFGHNFNMNHANQNGTEYRDYSDIMGSSGVGMRMLNAPHKEYMGWLAPDRIVTTNNGTYEIAPLELAPTATSLPQTIKIPNPAGGYFYLSFRQNIGFDAFMKATYSVAYYDRLNVHTAVGNAATNLVSVLDTGGVYTNSTAGLTVRVNSRGPASINVTVGTVCTANAPTIAVSPSTQGAAAGSIKTYTITVTNKDSTNCGSSAFNLARTLPAGFTGNFTNTTLNLAPGQSGSSSLSVTSPIGQVGGTYAVGIGVSDTATGTHTASATAYYVIDAIAPSIPTGLRLTQNKGKTLKIAWNSSTDNVGVSGYDVYRNGVKVSRVSTNAFTDSPGRGSFTYQVRAVDAAGNFSAMSASLTVSK